jgi:hypothetical protein
MKNRRALDYFIVFIVFGLGFTPDLGAAPGDGISKQSMILPRERGCLSGVTECFMKAQDLLDAENALERLELDPQAPIERALQKLGIENPECLIDFKAFEIGDNIVKPCLACPVGYCPECIASWFYLHKNCPTCRGKIDSIQMIPKALAEGEVPSEIALEQELQDLLDASLSWGCDHLR